MRGGENVVCKVGMVASDVNKRFWNVWEKNFGTYQVL